MKDKVSVIIPVYKVEDYLGSCLDSILRQTYSNIEIILVDDGSPDSSGKICDDYAEKDKRVHVIHQSNHGVTYARKKGVEASSGEWILFVDGDDEVVQDGVEFFLKKALDNNVQMVVSPEIKRRNGQEKMARFYCHGLLDKECFMESMSMQLFNGGIGGKFWKKELYYDGVLDASSKIKNNEDYLMNLRLAKNLKYAYVDAYKGVYIVNYRDSSASHTKLPKECWFVLYDELVRYSKDIGYYPLLYLMGSIEQRLTAGEVSFDDVKKYAKLFTLPSNIVSYLFYMHKWMKNGNIFSKIIFKFLRRRFRKRALINVYA